MLLVQSLAYLNGNRSFPMSMPKMKKKIRSNPDYKK